MEGNSITSFENLCRIFEMRIKLDKEKKVRTPNDVLDNYEKYSKKIDSIYNSDFQKQLKPLISPSVTLEKEEDRLRRLIKLLEERLDKRIDLEDRFYNTTGKYISGLQIIVSDAELEEKKERLSLISKYLETNREIENVTESISKLKDSLLEEEKKKEEYEDKNKIMEDELYSSFMDVIKNNEYYESISEDDINHELDEIRGKVTETKETLDITKESIGSLITSGLEDDYASYVEEAERSYFSYKNRELILKIYKLVISFEDDFKSICAKREKIGELLEEKKLLRESLSIATDEELVSFEETVLLQEKTLENEREVLENIANYTSRIKFKEERLEELNEVNCSTEILAILREYGLIETYDSEDIIEEELLGDEDEITGGIEIPTLEDSVVEKFYDPYTIVEVKDYPRTLNVGLAKLKGESVREKVNKKLNPKTVEPTFEDITSSIEKEEVNNDVVENTTLEFNKEESASDIDVIPVDMILQDNEVEEVNKEVVQDNSNEGEVKFETPVWELPIEVEPKPVTFESQDISNLPIWDNPEPMLNISELNKPEEINSIDITSKPEEVKNNDMFWVPVSDSKLETKDFPNINIPIINNFNGNDNFGFPTINN